jgi:hypothetical protein
MDWRKELEALRHETTALVSATPTTALDATRAPAPGPQAPIDLVVSILNEPSRPAPGPFNFGPSEREQISKRVENFKAHQERVRREREDYFTRTMQRARDTAKGDLPESHS